MTDTLRRFRAAAALDLMTLARLHDRELGKDTVADLNEVDFPSCLAFNLVSELGKESLVVLESAMAWIQEGKQEGDELAADFAAIYLNHTYAASPCESVWIDEDGLAMQEPMFQVREFYARHGFSAPNWRMRTDDHLVHQLQFIAELLIAEEPAALAEVARFLDEHTLRWLPDFAQRVSSRAATPFYAGLALLTAAYLEEVRDVLVQILDESRPSAEEIDRRMRPQRETVLPNPTRYVPGAAPSW